MGKFSYKKRKGTRKQSFKNRKTIKRGGKTEEESETPAPTPETPAPAPETPAPAPETPAPTTETPAPITETPAPITETPAPAIEQSPKEYQNPDVTGTAATPEGSYTSDDAGYQKFIENVKTNPEILNNVVFVNAGLSQIFLKQGDSWTEIKK